MAKFFSRPESGYSRRLTIPQLRRKQGKWRKNLHWFRLVDKAKPGLKSWAKQVNRLSDRFTLAEIDDKPKRKLYKLNTEIIKKAAPFWQKRQIFNAMNEGIQNNLLRLKKVADDLNERFGL